MKLLAIETCFGKCSLAFFDGINIYTKLEESKNSHRESLPKMLDEIILEGSFEIKDLDGVIVNHGPGTFTGIRIGIAFAQGLVASNDVPIYGVSTMEAVVTRKPQGVVGVAIKAIGEFCYYQKFFENGEYCDGAVYLKVAAVPKTEYLLTNCEIGGANITHIDFPNARNLVERFLFLRPKIYVEPLYLRQAL